MRRYNHRLRLKQYISQTGMHSRTGYICFAFLHYAGAYLMKVMKVRYIICQSVRLVGYDTGAGRRGGGGLGKAFGLAPNPIHWLISESAAHTASASASHWGSGELRSCSITEHQITEEHQIKLHTASVGLYHTQHQHQAGGGEVVAHSHAS